MHEPFDLGEMPRAMCTAEEAFARVREKCPVTSATRMHAMIISLISVYR